MFISKEEGELQITQGCLFAELAAQMIVSHTLFGKRRRALLCSGSIHIMPEFVRKAAPLLLALKVILREVALEVLSFLEG